MTIADDMRAASLGELNRTRAQLKTANGEIEQLRGVVMKDQKALMAAEAATGELSRELIAERYKAYQAEERAKDLARKLDKTQLENARLGWKLVGVLSSRESIVCAARGMWKVLMHVTKDTPLSKSTVVQNVEQESYAALLRIVRSQQAGEPQP